MKWRRDEIHDFVDWWLEEIRTMMPAGVRRCATSCARPDYTVRVAKDSVLVRYQANADAVEVPRQELAMQLGNLSGLDPKEKGPLVELVLEPGRYLERHLAPFRLPRRRARRMAVLDVQSATPLDPADAVMLFGKDDRSFVGHRYFITRKEMLATLFSSIESASARVAAVKIATGEAQLELEPEGYRHLLRQTQREMLAAKLLIAGTVICLLGMAATYAHARWRQLDGLRQLDATIEMLNEDVKVVRSLSDTREQQIRHVESVRSHKQQTVPLARIWEEMTRVIPDNSWLSDLSINESNVTITGLSHSAAGLIAALEASPLFRGPTFTAPVVKAPGMDAERFTIEMDLER
jgi:general secretion pathway protein L